jgi:hypothetical protein
MAAWEPASADPDDVVQERALYTLASCALAPTHLDALRVQVSAGRVVPRSHAALATLLESHRARPDAVLPVLDALLARDVADQRLSAPRESPRALRRRSCRSVVSRPP